MHASLRAGLLLVPLVVSGTRPDLYKIPLQGSGSNSTLVGTAFISPARSPFGLATTPEGFFVFDLTVDVPVLPPVSSFGVNFTTYVAWVASAELDQVERVGPLAPGTKLKGRVAMNKFLVFVTAETGPGGAKWSGPVVLTGRSPSSFLTNFSGHTMFNGGVPQ